MATTRKGRKAETYTRYPLSSVLVYNGTTIVHFLAGAAGIWIGYGYAGWPGYSFGLLYLFLSLAGMYVLMPLAVCPNCVYYRMKDSLCIAGINLLSRKLAKEGKAKDFPRRAQGLFCPNNLYIASLVVPIVAIVPALIIDFSAVVLVLLLFLVALLAFRFFVIFPKMACLHCKAKNACPQAEAMGVRNR